MKKDLDYKTGDAILDGKINVLMSESKSTGIKLGEIADSIRSLGLSVESLRNDINLANQKALEVEFRIKAVEETLSRINDQTYLNSEAILQFRTVLKFLIATITIVGVPTFLQLLSNGVQIVSGQLQV